MSDKRSVIFKEEMVGGRLWTCVRQWWRTL